MYSESDIDAAVAAGALTAGAAAQFRAYVAQQRTAPAVDEEYFRLITGFNDIFVSIAVILVLVAVGNLCGRISVVLGGVAVAAASWALAEYFTRRRRMALPSILLLLAFVGGIATVTLKLIIVIAGNNFWKPGAATPTAVCLMALAAGIIGGASYLHWRRFKVPITIAAGLAVIIGFGLALLMALAPVLRTHWQIPLACSGIGVFFVALQWDMSDRTRTTRRSDVAFWLHLLAAPLIVHPVFSSLGLLSAASTDASRALIAIAIYLLLAWVALLVDRRALLVSALAYVIVALAHVFKSAGAIGSDLALTALIVGAALLLLSAFWHKARRLVLLAAPGSLRARLPAI